MKKILGLVYIVSFLVLSILYIYGKSFSISHDDFQHDLNKLSSIAWLRCSIERYIEEKSLLPENLEHRELVVGTTNSPHVNWFASQSGVSFKPLEINKHYVIYNLCTSFNMDFGESHRAYTRTPGLSSFVSAERDCQGLKKNLYPLNPMHSKGNYCYVIYSSLNESFSFPLKELNSYDNFYENNF